MISSVNKYPMTSPRQYRWHLISEDMRWKSTCLNWSNPHTAQQGFRPVFFAWISIERRRNVCNATTFLAGYQLAQVIHRKRAQINATQILYLGNDKYKYRPMCRGWQSSGFYELFASAGNEVNTLSELCRDQAHWKTLGLSQYKDVLSLTWESTYLAKTVFVLRRGPDALCLVMKLVVLLWM